MKRIILTVCLALMFPLQAGAERWDNQDEYLEWLKEYGALDIYAHNLLQASPGTPEKLEYAEALLEMGDPDQALEVLQKIDIQDRDDYKGRVLFLQSRSYRQKEDFDKAVLHAVQSADYQGKDRTAELMRREQGLSFLWQGVWKRWYFSSLSVDDISQGRKQIMLQALRLGHKAWPEESFWEEVAGPFAQAAQAGHEDPARHTLTPSDTEKISQVLAAWSMGHWSMADRNLQNIQNRDLRNFWKNLGSFLQTKSFSRWSGDLKHSKSRGFKDIFALNLQDYALNNFELGTPDQGSWPSFLSRIKDMSESEALESVKQELSSALLPREVRAGLTSLEFIYTLQKQDSREAEKVWGKLVNKDVDLPFTLHLSAALLTGEHNHLHDLPGNQYPFFKELLNAAGMNIQSRFSADFWGDDQEDLQSLKDSYPLDYSINYLFWEERFQDQDDTQAARNLAFLFPNAQAGQSAYLFLAQNAYEQGHKDLAWRYLEQISQEFAEGNKQLDVLEAKAGILMDMGHEEESLETYQVLLSRDPQRLAPQRRLNLALMIQEKGRWGEAEEILASMWEQRDGFDKGIQAEILFWLGEGAQHQGRLEKALDNYLRLAWEFPEENIWAVTAMYRAGLIYEQREMYSVAARMFEKVIQNAGRESQKKAAEQRLSSVESRQKSDADGMFLF